MNTPGFNKSVVELTLVRLRFDIVPFLSVYLGIVSSLKINICSFVPEFKEKLHLPNENCVLPYF